MACCCIQAGLVAPWRWGILAVHKLKGAIPDENRKAKGSHLPAAAAWIHRGESEGAATTSIRDSSKTASRILLPLQRNFCLSPATCSSVAFASSALIKSFCSVYAKTG